MEQAMVAIAPWETLSANSQVLVWDVFWSWLFGMLHMAQIGIDHAQGDGRESNEIGQVTP